jgi:hypothetical protein
MEDIIPVVVGGFLALFSGAIVQWLTHRFSAKQEESKLLREKGEELCGRVDVLVRWMGERRNKTFALEEVEMHPPVVMLFALQDLYFQDAAAEAQNLGQKVHAMLDALSKARGVLSDAEKLKRGGKIAEADFAIMRDQQIDAVRIVGREFVAASTRMSGKVVDIVLNNTKKR